MNKVMKGAVTVWLIDDDDTKIEIWFLDNDVDDDEADTNIDNEGPTLTDLLKNPSRVILLKVRLYDVLEYIL